MYEEAVAGFIIPEIIEFPEVSDFKENFYNNYTGGWDDPGSQSLLAFLNVLPKLCGKIC